MARPPPSRGEPNAVNFTNINFESDGDDRLTEWMSEHRMVSWIVISDPKTVEGALLKPSLRRGLNVSGQGCCFCAVRQSTGPKVTRVILGS